MLGALIKFCLILWFCALFTNYKQSENICTVTLFEVPYNIQNTIAVDHFRTEEKKPKTLFSEEKKKKAQNSHHQIYKVL